VVETAEAFAREVRSNCPDIVLADYNLRQWTGLEAHEILHREQVDVPLILVTGSPRRRKSGRMSGRQHILKSRPKTTNC
jgi:CheY-like chemotaxis protein